MISHTRIVSADIKASITEPINVYEIFMNHGTYYVRIIKIPHY